MTSCPRCGHSDKARDNVISRAVNRLWRQKPGCPSRDVEYETEWGGEVCGCPAPFHVAGT